MIDECTMLPIRSFRALLLLKLWWPLQARAQRGGRERGGSQDMQAGRLAGRQGEPAVSSPKKTEAGRQDREVLGAGCCVDWLLTHQSWPTTKSAQNMVPWANQ